MNWTRLPSALAVAAAMLAAAPVAASDSAIARAEAALEADDFELAADILRAARADDAADAELAHLLALAEVGRRDFPAALEAAEAAARLQPDDARYQHGLAVTLLVNLDSMGRLRSARAARRMRAAWERTVELDPGHVEARLALVGFYAQAPGIIGGGRDKAVAQVAALRELDPVMAHRGQAIILLADDDWPAALVEYDAALAVADDDDERRTDLYMERGFLCQSGELWTCAHESFAAAVAIDPELMRAWYQVGRTAVFSGENIDEGIAAFERYLGHTPVDDDPSLAWARVRLGELRAMLGNADDARAEFQRVLADAPGGDEADAARAALTTLDD